MQISFPPFKNLKISYSPSTKKRPLSKKLSASQRLASLFSIPSNFFILNLEINLNPTAEKKGKAKKICKKIRKIYLKPINLENRKKKQPILKTYSKQKEKTKKRKKKKKQNTKELWVSLKFNLPFYRKKNPTKKRKDLEKFRLILSKRKN